VTEALFVLIVVVVVTALAFDFTNGFHDTGNAMATSIATGALRPRVAVGLSAALNLVGAFLSIEVAVARLELGGVKSDGVLTSIILPSIAAPLVAGFVAGVGTWLVFRIVAGVPEARRDEGFRWG
jgi:PiT family inorganic phosphate transporter